MKCPYCRVEFHDDPKRIGTDFDVDGQWQIISRTCPRCGRCNLHLVFYQIVEAGDKTLYPSTATDVILFKPKGATRSPCPEEVPKPIAVDYKEACLVLADSPKASAALSRRCLQNLLRDKSGVKHGDLANEIDQVLKSASLPSHLAEAIDAIRNIGNFAAHPLKSQHTGEILPVEPQEAEWNLDVLESLFDFYYVQPELLKKKKDALNKKLGEAGKPSMK